MLEPTNPTPDGLKALLRKAQRALAKTDVATYIEYVTGQVPAAHHVEMIQFALDIIDRKVSGVVLAPRGSGKTTILNTGLLPWLIALRPDIRIAILSQKAEKAEAMSGAVKAIVSESEEFIEIFGNLRGSHKWSDSEWLRKDSPHFKTKDRTMVAAGADQSSSVVSKRFDLIFCDDILDENNTYTIDRRDKIETWFWKTLKPTQAAEGCAVLVVGTRWVEDDLYQKLIEDNKWPSLVIPAIREEDGEEKSYWPAIWPMERLYAEREDVGWDNFACSYLNDISGLREGTIFRREWWKDMYFDELPRGRDYTFTIGIDLATSVKERADWTAGVLTAKDNMGEHWVLHHARIKTDVGHKDFVAGMARYAADRGWQISRIIMENTQAQEAVVAQIQGDLPELPIVGRRTDTDKRSRARGSASRYESHRVHHHSSLRGKELETELLSFDKGHDDLVDALGLSMDLSMSNGAMVGVTSPQRDLDDPRPMMPKMGEEVVFADGPQLVPAYMVSMMAGLDVETLSYEEAIQSMNARRLNDFIRNATKGMIRGR
jgi:phage terminase large subunit-like protein